ncbi:MAG: glycosyltransferase family 4 protein [Nitrospirae bacterium]|nr:glycosyltransferase family 4 protein [Nitrospirota bacterium]
MFISPLPPPQGGIASWTKLVLESELASQYDLYIVDTRIRGGRGFFDNVTFSASEQLRLLNIMGSLVYHLAKNRPDVVHLSCSLSKVGVFRDTFCALIVRLCGIPMVSHFRGNIPEPSGKSFHNALDLLIRLSNVNIAENLKSYEYIKKIVASVRCEQIPNFLPDDVFTNRVHYYGTSREHARVLFVAGLAFAKGLAEIVETARRLPYIHFDLIGAETADVKAITGQLPGNIKIMGLMNNPTVIEEMCNSDLFFLPSHTEGFPYSVLEAMAVGLPVISTRVGAIPEMIDDGKGGYLFEIGDVDGFVKGIRNLIASPDLRIQMGNYNKDKSKTLYSCSAVIPRLANIYNRLCAE